MEYNEGGKLPAEKQTTPSHWRYIFASLLSGSMATISIGAYVMGLLLSSTDQGITLLRVLAQPTAEPLFNAFLVAWIITKCIHIGTDLFIHPKKHVSIWASMHLIAFSALFFARVGGMSPIQYLLTQSVLN